MGHVEPVATRTLIVHAHWDGEAAVWVAESDEVPGLSTEAETAEALVHKLEIMIPELLEANSFGTPGPVRFRLLAERRGIASRAQSTADFAPELIRILRAAGCHFVRPGKGDHQIWYSPTSDRNFVVDGKIRSRHTASAVLKQAGLEKRF